MAYTFNPITNQLDYSGSGGGSVGSSITWQVVSGTNQSASPNYGYICQNTSLTQITLPTTAAVGTTITVVAEGVGGFQITQNAGQQIGFSSCLTTSGISGSVSSTTVNDTLQIVCVVANSKWIVMNSIGNFDVV